MSKFEEKTTIIKYVKYLIDFTSDLLEKHDFNFADYNQLAKEHESFVNQVNDTHFLPNEFKKEISSVNLNFAHHENKNALMRFISPFIKYRFGTTHYTKYNDYDLYELKEKMVEYKTRLTNIALTIDNHSFYR